MKKCLLTAVKYETDAKHMCERNKRNFKSIGFLWIYFTNIFALEKDDIKTPGRNFYFISFREKKPHRFHVEKKISTKTPMSLKSSKELN